MRKNGIKKFRRYILERGESTKYYCSTKPWILLPYNIFPAICMKFGT